MADTPAGFRRLERFYGEMTSVDAVLRGLAREGAPGKVSAADLYTRSLDVQNLGGFAMLERIAALAAEQAPPGAASRLVDVGCGVGGPGRYLADRFGCSVTGIDLLPQRIQAAAALTQMVGLAERVTYRQADATDLPFADGAFDQAWMLDASVHMPDKAALFREIARVLKAHGLLVMHDHFGPLPPSMRPVTRRAPYIAPSLAQMVRYVEAGGFRLLLWQDTTAAIRQWFEERRPEVVRRSQEGRGDRRRLQRRLAPFKAYTAALEEGMRTGVLIARRAG